MRWRASAWSFINTSVFLIAWVASHVGESGIDALRGTEWLDGVKGEERAWGIAAHWASACMRNALCVLVLTCLTVSKPLIAIPKRSGSHQKATPQNVTHNSGRQSATNFARLRMVLTMLCVAAPCEAISSAHALSLVGTAVPAAPISILFVAHFFAVFVFRSFVWELVFDFCMYFCMYSFSFDALRFYVF